MKHAYFLGILLQMGVGLYMFVEDDFWCNSAIS